jgi:hypothetical protein
MVLTGGWRSVQALPGHHHGQLRSIPKVAGSIGITGHPGDGSRLETQPSLRDLPMADPKTIRYA